MHATDVMVNASHPATVEQYPSRVLKTLSSRSHLGQSAWTSGNRTSAVIEAWIESDAPPYGDGFWLRITNDAMESPIGLSIPEGFYVLFDTVREAIAGDLVMVAFRERPEPLFRKLVADAGAQYLKALNPAWPISRLDGDVDSICVAIETKIRLVHDMT